jgi:hypothetical protein
VIGRSRTAMSNTGGGTGASADRRNGTEIGHGSPFGRSLPAAPTVPRPTEAKSVWKLDSDGCNLTGDRPNGICPLIGGGNVKSKKDQCYYIENNNILFNMEN